MIKGVSEMPNAILLNLKPAGFHMVPKPQLSEADVKAFKNALRLYAPGAKLKWGHHHHAQRAAERAVHAYDKATGRDSSDRLAGCPNFALIHRWASESSPFCCHNTQ